MKLYRLQSLSKEIRKLISDILHKEIKDPRIKSIITVSNVILSKDLSYAKIFLSFLRHKNFNIQNKDQELEIIKKARKFIRILLSKKLKTKLVPKLVFVYDNSLQYNINLYKLIKNNKIYD